MKLRLTRNVPSADAHEGESVDFEVLADVAANGIVVIPDVFTDMKIDEFARTNKITTVEARKQLDQKGGKIADGHAHRFRDTFAVELLLAGVPLVRAVE